MAQLSCRACGQPLDGRDVDFERLRVTCRHCGWQLGGGPTTAYRQAPDPKAPDPKAPDPKAPDPKAPSSIAQDATATPVALPPLPHNISVVAGGSDAAPYLDVTIRPTEHWRWVMALAIIVVSLGFFLVTRAPLSFKVGLSAFLVTVGYAIVAQNANTIRVRVTKSALAVTRSPIPWPAKRIASQDLDQLWVDDQTTRNSVPHFRLRARHATGDTTLLSLDEPSSALHLERRIEEMLGIADVPVAGEIGVPPSDHT